MTARFIPKESLAACQRWEMGAIGEPATRLDADVRLPTAREVQMLQEHAIREGYAAGLAEAQAQVARLSAVLGNVEAERERLRSLLATEVINLALDVAAHIVRTSLKVHPELILPAVREAIQTLPGVAGESLLVLNPADADFVRESLTEDLEHGRWRISADPTLAPGSCRIESAGGDIDATVASRWSRVIDALGADHAWIE